MIRARHRATRGFTLVELLTVITIIGILAGLMFVALGAAKKRAYIAKAQGETRELVKAWNAYWTTFGEWPPALKDAKNAEMNEANMLHLRGGNDMELYLIDAKMTSKGGVAGFEDPWGKLYTVDFSQTLTQGEDVYEACVAFPLQRGYEYDDM